MRVFDFDNTIYDGESGFDIFRYFFLKDPKRVMKYAPKFLEGFLRYKRRKITIDDVMNEYSYMLREYIVLIEDIEAEFESFWDIHQKKIKNFYLEIQDENDIIVSACPVCLLKIICGRLGIENYIGSDIDQFTGKINRICYKDKKVDFFREVYGDIQIDELYTDSWSDKPLMDISQNVYMVSGDKIKQIKKDGVSI